MQTALENTAKESMLREALEGLSVRAVEEQAAA